MPPDEDTRELNVLRLTAALDQYRSELATEIFSRYVHHSEQKTRDALIALVYKAKEIALNPESIDHIVNSIGADEWKNLFGHAIMIGILDGLASMIQKSLDLDALHETGEL